jgi:hypothetical protein
MAIIWSNEMVEDLKEWAKTKSASIISAELTEKYSLPIGRNSVIGKIFRLKLGAKPIPVVSLQQRRENQHTKNNGSGRYINSNSFGGFRNSNVLPFRRIHPGIDINKTPPLMICIDELDEGNSAPGGRCKMCRYPDKNAKGVTVYCGLPTGGYSSWCSYHRDITTVEPRARLTISSYRLG